jgi:hypothetical protein
MTIYHGDIKEDEPISWDFNTNSTASVPITLAGSPTLAVYKDANLTQSTTGPAITVDFDGVTGLHHVAVVTTDSFYVTGSDYSVVLAAGTVDSVSVVGVVVGSFSIENRLMTGTDSAALATALSTAQTDITQIKGDLPGRVTKNTALANFMFLMITASDDTTPLTGASVTATRSIDGAAFGSCANSVTEVSNGWYKINLAAADLNGDVIALRFVASSANATNMMIMTQST